MVAGVGDADFGVGDFDFHFMTKTMVNLTVSVAGKQISIMQEDPNGNDPSGVVINPDQVDFLIEWLKEARDEIHGNTA